MYCKQSKSPLLCRGIFINGESYFTAAEAKANCLSCCGSCLGVCAKDTVHSTAVVRMILEKHYHAELFQFTVGLDYGRMKIAVHGALAFDVHIGRNADYDVYLMLGVTGHAGRIGGFIVEGVFREGGGERLRQKITMTLNSPL